MLSSLKTQKDFRLLFYVTKKNISARFYVKIYLWQLFQKPKYYIYKLNHMDFLKLVMSCQGLSKICRLATNKDIMFV